MKKIANTAAYIFIFSVVLLTVVSVLGVWDFFNTEVILKSFQSVGYLALVSVIVIFAEHFMDKKEVPVAAAQTAPVVNPTELFHTIRISTVSALIGSAGILALTGILSIWEVLSKEVFGKSLASIAIITFSSLVIFVTCLGREENPMLRKKNFSAIAIIVFIIAFLALFSSLSSLFY